MHKHIFASRRAMNYFNLQKKKKKKQARFVCGWERARLHFCARLRALAGAGERGGLRHPHPSDPRPCFATATHGG